MRDWPDRRMGKQVGHPHLTSRSLRQLPYHGTTVALQTGQNIVVVSERLGHSNVSILLTSTPTACRVGSWKREATDYFEAMMMGED